MAPPVETRARILASAVRLLSADAHRDLVLDDVAREAGISKGGLLHHFPTKRALYEGVIEGFIASFEGLIRHRMDADPVERGRFLRAYLAARLDDDLTSVSALTTAACQDPTLLAPFMGRYRHWLKQALSDGVPAPDALAIFYCAEGISMDRLLGFPLAPPAELSALVTKLVASTRGAS